eukprot:GEMP01028455.1.p1 GENE.GEMP01028455.1~~GEMP01028455.1.p1  ORF type:complete len:287 (+),score=56.16 GEMP01028455.1:64-924(+)
MVLRTLQVYPGGAEQLRLHLGDVVNWNISVRDGYDIALRIKFLPVENVGDARKSRQGGGVSATLADGRKVRVKDKGPRIFGDFDRSTSFKGQLLLNELDDDDGMTFDKHEWDIVFVLENNYSYFTKKVVDLEIVIEGAAETKEMRESVTRGLSQYGLEQRPDRTPERVFCDSVYKPSETSECKTRSTESSEHRGGNIRSPRDTTTASAAVSGSRTNTRDVRSLISDDDPDIQRCLEAKAQVDFVWMRCMLKDAQRRCPADATKLRDLFSQAQGAVETYIDAQFMAD